MYETSVLTSKGQSYRKAWKPPIIAAIGLSFFIAGSTSKAKLSNVVAPSKYMEFFGAKITWLVNVSSNPEIVNNASPRSLRSLLPSASINSLLLSGLIPIFCKRSSGTKLYKAPVSTQKSSSKKSLGSAGLATLVWTLNMPIILPSVLGNNIVKILRKINTKPIINISLKKWFLKILSFWNSACLADRYFGKAGCL